MEKAYLSLNSIRICIDARDPESKGRAYSPLSDEEFAFADLGSLFLRLDAFFDAKGYPQAFEDKRSFDGSKEQDNRYKGRPETSEKAAEILTKSGKIATYDVILTSRRNTSWQGMVFTPERVKVGEFKGEMELLKILEK